jgi:hypothetical protein
MKIPMKNPRHYYEIPLKYPGLIMKIPMKYPRHYYENCTHYYEIAMKEPKPNYENRNEISRALI